MYAVLTENGKEEIERFDTHKAATDYQANMFIDGIKTVVRPVDMVPEAVPMEKIKTKAFCAVRESPRGDNWLDLGTISVHGSAVRTKVEQRKPAFNKDYPVAAIIAVTVEWELP